jgi:hypothetical protein
MPTSIIVYGPQGCGKTRHAKVLARHFDLPKVLDTGVDGVTLARLPHTAFSNTLVLTCEDPGALPAQQRGQFQLIPYADAAKAAGVFRPVNQSDQE